MFVVDQIWTPERYYSTGPLTLAAGATTGLAGVPPLQVQIDQEGIICAIFAEAFNPASSTPSDFRNQFGIQLLRNQDPITSNIAISLADFAGTAQYPSHIQLPVKRNDQLNITVTNLNTQISLGVSVTFGLVTDGTLREIIGKTSKTAPLVGVARGVGEQSLSLNADAQELLMHLRALAKSTQ
jgi:hypothetical protein